MVFLNYFLVFILMLLSLLQSQNVFAEPSAAIYSMGYEEENKKLKQAQREYQKSVKECRDDSHKKSQKKEDLKKMLVKYTQVIRTHLVTEDRFTSSPISCAKFSDRERPLCINERELLICIDKINAHYRQISGASLSNYDPLEGPLALKGAETPTKYLDLVNLLLKRYSEELEGSANQPPQKPIYNSDEALKSTK